MQTKKILTLFLILTGINYGYSQLTLGGDCYGDHPTYYTKTLVYLYQNMDSESAIVGEVPKGTAVKVTSSAFGSTTGFWTVCYNGKSGYAKKSQLSYKTVSSTKTKPTNSSDDISTDNNQDVGFDPFLGQTTSAVNFRNGPSSSSGKIKTLSAGITIYVYSDQSVNGYYKAIDVMTSDIGWVYKKYVQYVQDIEVSESGAFQSTGYSSNYNSEVNIENKSSYTIKLIVDTETFTLSPNSTKKLDIKPGRKYYIASAPGVIPASGYQSFESNNGYEWSFWVSTTRN